MKEDQRIKRLKGRSSVRISLWFTVDSLERIPVIKGKIAR